VTRRLTDPELASLGWPNREGLYTAHELLENYRLTSDNRILGGSKEIHYAYGSKLAEGYQPRSFELLTTIFYERFPMLRHVPIETFWGGWIAMTPDFLPISGWLGAQENLAYYSGCNGHGIPQCTFMGDVMGRVLLGAPSRWTALLDRWKIPIPPEPIRTVAVKAINWYCARKDLRIDAELRLANSARSSTIEDGNVT
jgi:glycine/D-amino acid oxidase-like deaminating enzyme